MIRRTLSQTSRVILQSSLIKPSLRNINHCYRFSEWKTKKSVVQDDQKQDSGQKQSQQPQLYTEEEFKKMHEEHVLRHQESVLPSLWKIISK